MVEASIGQRKVPLLWATHPGQRTDHGPRRADFPGGTFCEGQCGSSLQTVQYKKKQLLPMEWEAYMVDFQK